MHNAKSFAIKEIPGVSDPFELFKRIYSHYNDVFILESLVGPKELAEISVIGFDPQVRVKCTSRKFTVTTSEQTRSFPVKDPVSQLRELVPRVRESRYRFVGGAVGYISYDAVRYWERLPKKAPLPTFPLLEFGIFYDGVIYNHQQNQAYYFHTGESRLRELDSVISIPAPKANSFKISRPARNTSKAGFSKIVDKAKGYIYDGDVFQVVLSKKIEFKVRGDLLPIYEQLREINPSPYMYFFRMGQRCIIGSSPEMLLRVSDGAVETFPIAGTRPVTGDSVKDELYRKDLLNDEKELAEHTMLVDLARNDVGRVCEFGSVKVNELMAVKKFSHVQHIVSHVTGKLAAGMDSFDAMKAVFPAGTVSGAPKVRAMEIIDELERAPRGPYAGAIGYFSFNGSCDFAILIRSIFVSRDAAFVQSGAGIVMDSNPGKEWLETEHKAGAMVSALKAKRR